MRVIHLVLFALARFFLSAIFLAAGVKTILNWHETETSLIQAFSEWQAVLSFSETGISTFSFLIGWSPFVLLVGAFLLFVGGLSVLLGIREKWGAFLLILFLIPITLLFHPFWLHEGMQREMSSVMFLKNLAILGGLLLLTLHQGRSESALDPFPRM